jgi:DNA primase
VDFYLQNLLEEIDLDDTKAKARVVDTLLPVLRAVANPIEREDYVQKIARALRVDARAVQSRLRSTQRRRAQPRNGISGGQDQPPGRVAAADLEGYCLSALLQRPGTLSQVNEALRESQLEPLHGQDFQDVGYRAIFEVWETLLATEGPVSLETLRAQLPTELHARLEELHSSDKPELADEQLARDVSLTLLRNRERNLRRLGQELNFLTTEAQEAGDIRAQQYVSALQAYTQTLLRTQQALAQRWGWVSRG